jgi:hypothetical protein
MCLHLLKFCSHKKDSYATALNKLVNFFNQVPCTPKADRCLNQEELKFNLEIVLRIAWNKWKNENEREEDEKNLALEKLKTIFEHSNIGADGKSHPVSKMLKVLNERRWEIVAALRKYVPVVDDSFADTLLGIIRKTFKNRKTRIHDKIFSILYDWILFDALVESDGEHLDNLFFHTKNCTRHHQYVVEIGNISEVVLKNFLNQQKEIFVPIQDRDEYKNAMAAARQQFDVFLDNQKFSEILLDRLFVFPVVDLIYYVRKFHLIDSFNHNKNVEWNSGVCIKSLFGNYKWVNRPDSFVQFAPNQDGYGPLLITGQYAAALQESDSMSEDYLKVMYQLLLSSMFFQALEIPQFCLFGWILQHKQLSLYAMFKLVGDDKCSFGLVDSFDMSNDICYERALLTSFKIFDYIKLLEPVLHEKRTHEAFHIAECDSSSTSTDSYNDLKDPENDSPSNSQSSISREKSSEEQHGDEDAILQDLRSSGLFHWIKRMSSHKRRHKFYRGVLSDTKEAVIIKIASLKERTFNECVRSQLEIPYPRMAGFLLPICSVRLSDREFVGLVMEEVKVMHKWSPWSGCNVLSASAVVHYSGQLLDFLRRCEKAGIVHGDLKPGNVGLTKDGFVVVFDWEPDVGGTEGYLAPELEKDRLMKPNFESDLFSAGLVLEYLKSFLLLNDMDCRKQLSEIINILKSKNPEDRRAALRLNKPKL